MSVLGIDTSTAATAVCVERPDGEYAEVAPKAGDLRTAPAHAVELMPAVDRALSGAGLDWSDLRAVAVGVGPGAYTGLRIGVATARALAQALAVPIHPISSLAALAAGAGAELVLTVVDARRGEVFAALYRGPERLWGPLAAPPERVAERMRAELPASAARALAVGDGSIRFRDVIETADVEVPPDESGVHVIRALHVCRLAAGVPAAAPEAVLPNYLRAPDARPWR